MVGRDLEMLALQERGEARAGMVGVADRARQHVAHRQHAAQGLEGAEAEALALVLDPDLVHAQPLGQRRQPVQRRHSVGGAFAQLQGELGHAVGIDHELLVAAEGQVAVQPGIFGQPGGEGGSRHAGVIAC